MGERATRFWAWYRAHDPGLAALRRAGRAAILMPLVFAFADKVIANPAVAVFAAFGSFGSLVLVDFGGPMGDRLRAQASFAAVGALFVCLGTLASRSAWLAAGAMAVVGFCVLFAGAVSSVLASATVGLLLAFILPVCLKGPASSIPDRLAGWGLASAVAFVAVWQLWPAPVRDPLRGAVVAACRGLAERLRADVVYLIGRDDASRAAHDKSAAAASSAVAGVQRVFFGLPYRPTGLTTAARTVVRLVDELTWLNAIVTQAHPDGVAVDSSVCAVKQAAAALLDESAAVLEARSGASGDLDRARGELQRSLRELEQHAAQALPAASTGPARAIIDSLDPGFRAQQLGFAVSQIAENAAFAAAAERRSFLERLLGRQPSGFPGPLAAAQRRAFAHFERHSVWLHNSVRGAIGLGFAVLVADLSGVQHAFWVVLGTLSVLRSNALSTGQNVLRGIAGTTLGVLAGALLLQAIGTDTTVLWFLLPPAVLLAAVAPSAVSFLAGQAAFTVTIVLLFNIIQPAGWRVGLVRIEDVALGCAVSLAVGLLFWPRGAGAALGQALSEAYVESARFLAAAVGFGVGCCDAGAPSRSSPSSESLRAAAAAQRLDDAFRNFLAERGAKPVSLADVSGLVAGVVGLRLMSEAVLDLWDGAGTAARDDRSDARSELLESTTAVEGWYEELAAALARRGAVPDALAPDEAADSRLVEVVRRDLGGGSDPAAVAVRILWTGDHLDAARRLQATLVAPARAVTERGMTASPFLRRLDFVKVW
ncbi:MAG TPA: FUSC family protein [Gaiellaceae bacterium]|nr:FUSC family protein [Gaiellaceae bacterium]